MIGTASSQAATLVCWLLQCSQTTHLCLPNSPEVCKGLIDPWRPKWPCRIHRATLFVTTFSILKYTFFIAKRGEIEMRFYDSTAPQPWGPLCSLGSLLARCPAFPPHQPDLTTNLQPSQHQWGSQVCQPCSIAMLLAGGRTRSQVSISRAQAGLSGALHTLSKSREHPTNSAYNTQLKPCEPLPLPFPSSSLHYLSVSN